MLRFLIIAIFSAGVGGCSDPAPKRDSAGSIFEEVQGSVLKVYSMTHDGGGRSGTGFFIEINSEPVILTSKHVVQNANAVIVESEDDTWAVTSWREHPEFDLAVIPVEKRRAVKTLEIAEGTRAEEGQSVVTVGYPLGDSIAVHEGNVSSVDGLNIVFSAPLSTGASGSPLMDRDGRVLGICYSFVDNAQNYNLAVPVQLLLLDFEWENRRGVTDRNLDRYLRTISKIKNFQKKCAGEWESVQKEFPSWGNWIVQTQVTREHLLGAIEGVVLSVHGMNWASFSGRGGLWESEVEKLLGKIKNMNKAWDLHRQNIRVASERLAPKYKPLVNLKWSDGFINATNELSEKFDMRHGRKKESLLEADVKLLLTNYLREESNLFEAGVP